MVIYYEQGGSSSTTTDTDHTYRIVAYNSLLAAMRITKKNQKSEKTKKHRSNKTSYLVTLKYKMICLQKTTYLN